MHVVVNHLHLRDPMPPEMVEKAHAAVRGVVDAGGRAAHVAKVDDRRLVLILVFDGPEDAARVARDVGGPWMRENVVPLLARDTEEASARSSPLRRPDATGRRPVSPFLLDQAAI